MTYYILLAMWMSWILSLRERRPWHILSEDQAKVWFHNNTISLGGHYTTSILFGVYTPSLVKLAYVLLPGITSQEVYLAIDLS